jgi:hypothetical protein
VCFLTQTKPKAVNKHGRVEVTKPANFTAKEDGNPSLIGYKLIEEWLLRGKCYSTG